MLNNITSEYEAATVVHSTFISEGYGEITCQALDARVKVEDGFLMFLFDRTER